MKFADILKNSIYRTQISSLKKKKNSLNMRTYSVRGAMCRKRL